MAGSYLVLSAVFVFGDFYLKDKYILIKAPFVGDAEVWAGILEGLFEIELDVKTSAAPLVFEIEAKQDAAVTQ